MFDTVFGMWLVLSNVLLATIIYSMGITSNSQRFYKD